MPMNLFWKKELDGEDKDRKEEKEFKRPFNRQL